MIITKRDCEIVKQLIYLYCDSDPGLGCYRRLVEVANGAITDDEIRRMAGGGEPSSGQVEHPLRRAGLY